MRILVLEDEYLIAMDIEQLCRDHGAGEVSICREIPDIPADAPVAFDVAILDVMLHDESTLSFAESLRSRGIPFVFASGYADDVDKFAPFSGVPVIGKPYSPEGLIGAILEATKAASA
jgi:CheY-like chemotaxis protein